MIHEDYHEFKRFEHELVLETTDKIKEYSNNIVFDSLVKINPSEYFYHIQMYIDVIKNAIYFKDMQMLEKYLFWRYRVYFYRKIDMEFFLIENEIIKKQCAFYFETSRYLRLETLF